MKYLVVTFIILLIMFISILLYLVNYKGKIELIHNILIGSLGFIIVIEFVIFWIIIIKLIKMVLM